MPTYKLHYFNIRGRAEVARLIMAHANVEYEDYRFEFNDFATIKASKKHLGYLERLSWFSKEKRMLFPRLPVGPSTGAGGGRQDVGSIACHQPVSG